MTRRLPIVLSTLWLLSGCALPGTSQVQAPQAKRGDSSEKHAAVPKSAKTAKADPGPSSEGRRVGDYFVHRYSGSYSKQPLTVTEEVIAREGSVFIVEYTFELADGAKELRARVDAKTDEVLDVVALRNGEELPFGREAFRALVDKTVFTPDINEALVAQAKETCLVGTKALDCELETYRVYVGDQAMTLKISRAQELGGRDVSGEVVGVDGKVVYRAELIDAGNDAAAAPGAAAMNH